MLRTRGHRFSVTSAVVSNDARFLFTSGKDGCIIKWDLHSGTKLATFHKLRPGNKGKEKAVAELPGHSDAVLTLALSDDGRYLASAGKDRRVGVWDVEKGKWVRGFGGHRDTISVRDLSLPLAQYFSHISKFRLWRFGKALSNCTPRRMTAR